MAVQSVNIYFFYCMKLQLGLAKYCRNLLCWQLIKEVNRKVCEGSNKLNCKFSTCLYNSLLFLRNYFFPSCMALIWSKIRIVYMNSVLHHGSLVPVMYWLRFIWLDACMYLVSLVLCLMACHAWIFPSDTQKIDLSWHLKIH